MLAVEASVTKPRSSSNSARAPGCNRRGPVCRPGSSASGCGTSAPAASSPRGTCLTSVTTSDSPVRYFSAHWPNGSGCVCMQTVGPLLAGHGGIGAVRARRDENRQAEIVGRIEQLAILRGQRSWRSRQDPRSGRPGSTPTISSDRASRDRCSSSRNSLPPNVRSCSATVVPCTKPASNTLTAACESGIQRPFR